MDSKDLMKKLNGSVDYSGGFFDGIQMERITFMKFLAGFTREALYKYIDSRARVNPDALHHVYEPNKVGSSDGRLYKFEISPRLTVISFKGEFLPSSISSDTSNEPFVNKAKIMENQISVTIAPKNSDVLVFENNGELVFTRNSIIIEHPGGDEVAGAFGKVVDEFFSQYLTNSLLKPLFRDLSTADEFAKSFSSGTRAAGVRAGKKYLDVSGVVFE